MANPIVTDRPQLSDNQADALRLLVEDARCRDGLRLAKGTDRNARTVNSRVARALADHGLVEITDGDNPGEWAIATDAGRELIHAAGPVSIEEFWAGDRSPTDADLVEATRDVLAVAGTTGIPVEDLDADALAVLLEDSDAVVVEGRAYRLADAPDDTGDVVDPADGTADEDGTAAGLPTQTASDVDDLDVAGWVTKLSGGAAHNDPLPLGDHAMLLVTGRIGGVAFDVKDDFVTRSQTVKVATIRTVPARWQGPLRRFLDADRPGAQVELPLDGDSVDAELVDRLNREELQIRDEDGRREWPDDGPSETVSEERVRAVLDTVVLAGDKGTPARNLDLAALQTLAARGQVEVKPDWFLDDPDRILDEGQLQVTPWAYPIPERDVVAGALADAEQARPQVRLVERDGVWKAVIPPAYERTDDAAPGLLEARQVEEVRDRVEDYLDVGGLVWRVDAAGWVADLPDVQQQLEVDPFDDGFDGVPA